MAQLEIISLKLVANLTQSWLFILLVLMVSELLLKIATANKEL
jgi:hypothetical protein